MNFLTKKVLDFQQKKLSEAEKKLQYHLAKKEQLGGVVRSENIKKEIVKEEEMIKIWTRNIDKIRQEIKKIQVK
jgi:hypothetical protein